MEGAPGGPPAAPRDDRQPRLGDDARPATLGELRTLRRWLAVTAAWAVAATAIAVIAFLTADEGDRAEQDAAGRTERLARELDSRIDALDARVEGLPGSEELARIERRLKTVEAGATRTNGRFDDLEQQVGDLEQQLEELEDASATTDTTDTTTTP